jgi:RNA polymerase sigma-70 factor (ECF subfamily)
MPGDASGFLFGDDARGCVSRIREMRRTRRGRWWRTAARICHCRRKSTDRRRNSNAPRRARALRKAPCMTLKITALNETPELVTLQIEGRLTVDAVAELKAVCAAPLGRGTPVVLHLTHVSFVDAVGVEELRDLERRGCVLVGVSDFVAALLAPEPGRRPAEPTAPDASEAEHLLALRSGDAAAFERLVRRQSAPLLAVARRILNNDDDARDAVQETFLSAYRNLHGFAGEARVSTWLHRIVVNAALMKLRTRRRRPEKSIDELLPCFDENGAWVSGMARTSGGVEAQLESRERRELVRRCIAQLPETYREVLVLRDIEDLDTTEVAVGLGITANAVKIRLHRARQALRTLIERDAPTVASASGEEVSRSRDGHTAAA